MKSLFAIILKLSASCLLLVLISQTSVCHAAPLPERIRSRSLQRDDCVVREDMAHERAEEETLLPYIQEFVLTDDQLGVNYYSCINWWHGFLKSEGSGKEKSRFAAELVAKSNALKTLLVANINAQATLQEYFERRNDAMLSIRNVLVQNAQVENLPPNPQKPDEARVMVTVPFYGISGLLSFFLDDEEIYLAPPKDTPEEQQPSPGTMTTGDYTGILIDAGEIAGLEPALFPQVLSESGELVYTASQVERSVLQEQGMVQYATDDDDSIAKRVGLRPLVVRPILVASTAVDPLLLAEAKSRDGKGRGNKLVLIAIDSEGQRPVNVVITVEDAQKLKQLNQQQKFDKQAKYIILIGREISGVQGTPYQPLMVMNTE